jgi:hypothetical protein
LPFGVVVQRTWLLLLLLLIFLLNQLWRLLPLKLLFLLLKCFSQELLVLAPGEIAATALQIVFLLLYLFVLGHDVDLTDEELRAAHFDDVARLKDVLALLAGALLASHLIGLRLYYQVHPLAHVIREECLHPLVIIARFEISCFYLLFVISILGVQQLISNRGPQYELVSLVLDLKQELGLFFVGIRDDCVEFDQLAIKIFADEVARSRSQ